MPELNEMNGRSRGRPAAPAVVVLAVLACALLAAGSAPARSTGQGFTDPHRDANGGPDITHVAISDLGGLLTFKFTVSGMKFVAGSGVKGATFYAGLDTDKNGKSNYYLDVYTDDSGVSWDVEGPTEKLLKRSPTMAFFSTGNSYTFKVSSSDLGGATGFDFYVSSAMQDDAGKRTDGDDAPDGGRWAYALTSLKPEIGAPSTSRPKPMAGKSFVITFPVTRSDSGTKLTSGGMTSAVTIAGVALKPVAQLKNGTALLRFTVPAAAKGKPLAVRVTVDFAGRTVTKSASFRVG